MSGNSKGFTLIELLAVIIIMGVVGIFVLSIFAASGEAPDESVMRAARAMTPDPSISNGQFAWVGCSNGDTLKYEVTDKNGKYIGYVCQGWNIIPGLKKGATPRF